MEKRWYCCEKCNEVNEYNIYDNGDTDFPRGEFIVCGNKYDALTTGFKTEKEAAEYLQKRLSAQQNKESSEQQATNASGH